MILDPRITLGKLRNDPWGLITRSVVVHVYFEMRVALTKYAADSAAQ